MNNRTGQIVRSHGRHFVVEIDGQEYGCTTRGKRTDYVCGDYVDISIQNCKQGVIEHAYQRCSLLYRQDNWKTKKIAANVTRMLFVIAAVPRPNEELLNRCLIAAEAADIDPVIVINKADLSETAALLTQLNVYRTLGYTMITVSAHESITTLVPLLSQQTSILLGQSGMGKSTLTNVLLPNAQARIGNISKALNAGRHTTTHTTLLRLDTHSCLIDSPGLQEFGLRHLKATELLQFFPEMRPLIGKCRFHNCAHNLEPDCVIKLAAKQGLIHPIRLNLLQKLTHCLA